MKTLNFQKKSLAEIFVSRPPRKNATGEVHQETIRTLNPNKKEYSEKDVKSGRNIRGGLANNGNMLRVDVFSKKNAKGKEEFYLVPVYLADRANDCLPNKAIVAQKPEEEWTVMDETYLFKFSLYKDDLMAVIKKGEEKIFGYYKGTHSRTAGITIEGHDRSFIQAGIGVKTVDNVKKYQVDPLGRYVEVKSEPRLPICLKKGKA